MVDVSVERWLPVAGHEGSYEVSDCGRVRSLPRLRRGPFGSAVRVFERVLSSSRTGSGYLDVSLGRGKKASIHRLVAAAFLPNPGSLAEVNHINGIKTDNRVDNLEWVSHQQNAAHASAMGLLATGRRHGRYTKPEAFNARS